MATQVRLDIVTQAARRVARRDYEAWAAAAAAAGWCSQPVRLTGTLHRADAATGELISTFDSNERPDRVLLKACQSRRATLCAACAAVYQSDARALILAGLVGGKGIAEAVAERPAVFVTLTAPSFGPVHTHRPLGAGCQPRATARVPAGHVHRCGSVHADDDPSLGTPICALCYDWEGTVVFNARVGELWRRSVIATRRALAGRVQIPIRVFERLCDHRLRQDHRIPGPRRRPRPCPHAPGD